MARVILKLRWPKVDDIMNSKAYQWTGGLISVASGAAAGALSGTLGPMIAAPTVFNLDAGFHKIMVSAEIGAGITIFIAVLNFLAKSPLPGWQSTTTTVEERDAHTTQVIQQGDKTVEERSPHTTKITTVSEVVAPVGTTPPTPTKPSETV